MAVCVGETAQLMVPVRAVRAVRCSAKVTYCTKERGWERISIGKGGHQERDMPNQRASGGPCEIPRDEKKGTSRFAIAKK